MLKNTLIRSLKLLGTSTVIMGSSVAGCLVGAALALVAAEDRLDRRYGSKEN